MSQLIKAKGPVTGVCGGLGVYFNLDPTIVRVLFVALGLFTGGIAVIIYIVLAIVMPKNEMSSNSGSGHSSNASAPTSNENVVFCKSCGAKNEQKGKFCRKCGEPL